MGLEAIGLQVFAPSHGLLKAAAALTRKFEITFYDASFVAMAQEMATELITADAKMAAKTSRLGFVGMLSDYETGN